MDYEQEHSAETLGADGIFLRAADRKRFDYVMRAVCNDGQCLALSSTNESVLDHYGRLVINKLRQTPDLQIEVFLPTSTEALLDRFNQILAGLSLTDARDAISSPAPRRVLVAHDAKSIDARDIGLMARLIEFFTKSGELVLDPFAGVGGTLLPGLFVKVRIVQATSAKAINLLHRHVTASLWLCGWRSVASMARPQAKAMPSMKLPCKLAHSAISASSPQRGVLSFSTAFTSDPIHTASRGQASTWGRASK